MRQESVVSNETVQEGQACPVSGKLINERAARLAAFLALPVLTVFFLTSAKWIILLLAADYLMRATGHFRLSVLSRSACALLEMSGAYSHMVDAAPKMLAARLALTCSLVAGIASLFGGVTVALAFAGMLTFCVALEAFAGFCLGCWMYQLPRLGIPRKVKA